MTAAWDKAETARLLAEAKAWPVNTGWSFIRTMHGLAAQLEAAGVEIERLTTANASLIPGGEVECLLVEHDAARAKHSDSIDAISDALHRAGVGDSPRLVDRIALAGEELHRLRRAVMDGKRSADHLIDGVHDLTNERDSLRQQLEAARRDSDTYARDHRDSVEDEAKLAADLAADLAAAQQRIAELEGELASARDDRGRLLGERVMFAAALRAVAPVWQTAAAEQTATAIPDENGQPMPCECASCCAVRTSLARLTPELLAVIEALTR